MAFIATLFTTSSMVRAEGDNGWTFAVAPYLWLPGIHSTARFVLPTGAAREFDVDIGAEDYLDDLKMALLLTGEARRGRWAIITDFVYLNLSSQASSVKAVEFTAGRVPVGAQLDAGSKSTVKGVVWSLGAGYTMWMDERGSVDVVGGFRYFGAEIGSDWSLTGTITGPRGTETFPATGSVTQDDSIWDALIGLRGRLVIASSAWFIPYYIDIGTGTSNVTWQGVTGIAYAFSRIDVALNYRYLYFGGFGDELIQNMSFSGPVLGVAFRF